MSFRAGGHRRDEHFERSTFQVCFGMRAALASLRLRPEKLLRMRRLAITLTAVALAGAWLLLHAEEKGQPAPAAPAGEADPRPEQSRAQPRKSSLRDEAGAAAIGRAQKEPAPIEGATAPLEKPATIH